MFGAISSKTAQQLARAFDFADWCRPIYVLQSGLLRVETLLRQVAPAAPLYGSDTGLIPVALGKLAAGQTLDFRFSGRLAELESVLGDAGYLDRVAALLFAQQLARYKGDNDYSRKHWAHLWADIDRHIAEIKSGLAESVQTLSLEDVAARSTVDHANEAMRDGRAIVGYLAGSNQASATINFVDANADWARPGKDAFSRRDVAWLLDALRDAGLPHAIATDQQLDGHEPVGASVAGAQRIWFYGTARGTTYARDYGQKDSFAYDTVTPAAITERTRCAVVPVTSAFAQYVRQLHIAKNITLNATGASNFAVLLDGKVAGILIYNRDSYASLSDRSVYLLSDITVSQQARLSKLVSMLAASREVLDMVERDLVQRVDRIVTTARSERPVSMKYRGIFELVKRRDATPPETGFILQYASEAKPLPVQKTFRQWWVKHGREAAAALQAH